MRMGPHGIPLDDTTLNAMSQEERRFWLDFLESADLEIDREKPRPIKPSPHLQEMYAKAIKDYDGGVYCQVNQLREIFSFA